MRRRVSLYRILLLTIFFFQLYSCKGSDSHSDNVSSPSQLSTQLKTVSTNMTPNALRSSNSLDLLSGDPCSAFTDQDRFRNFLSCQPTLLASYIHQASAFVAGVGSAIESIESALSNATDGSGGSITDKDGKKISYSKIDIKTFTIEVSAQSGQKLVSLYKNAEQVTFKLDAWFLQENASTYSSEFGSYEGTLQYTDDNNWSLNLFLAGIPCDSKAADSPERIKLIVSYSKGIWTGKAMSYHPRKSGDSCTDSSHDTSKMNVFTDFVGDKDATKASVYMLNHQVSNLDNILNFQIGKFCVNYSNICNDNSVDYTTMTPSVTLPFCITATGKEPIWGNSCADNANITNAEYKPINEWVLPSEFYKQAVPTAGL